MKTIVTISLALLSALIVAGSKLEATEGQNVTISFDIDEVEKADPVKITFKQDGKENAVVIAQHPWTYDEPPPAGVSLLVEKRHVNITIRHVSISRNSGLYTAQAFFGKKVSEINATLVINTFSSTSKPLKNSSQLLQLYALIPLLISGGCLLL